jgi:hypothetical protein
MRRIAKIALAVAVAAAAAQAIRWLLERDDEAAQAPLPPEQTFARAENRDGAAPSGASAAGGPTREELYREARRLEIQGRSKMNKRELQEAVEAAKTGGAL